MNGAARSNCLAAITPCGARAPAVVERVRRRLIALNRIAYMRAVARLGEGKFPLYGADPYEASRIDSFLDASLVFA